MARTKKRARSKPRARRSGSLPFHAFWSGSLSFGLVNVPVLVYPASRHAGVRLRLISPEGSLLERRFFCPRDDQEVSGDEIVRGYELEEGSYVIVDDRELEAVEPQKTQEIDLRMFVDLAELPPEMLERGYYLTPAKEANKAYHLLAEALERTERAGIGTFLMREREYLVAVFARGGILCAQTLRFHDELRDPKTLGVPETGPAPRERASGFQRAIDALSAKTIARAALADPDTRRLRALIEKKHKAGKDIVHTGVAADGWESNGEAEVDILETIRRSLRRSPKRGAARGQPVEPSPNATRDGRKRKVAARAPRRDTRAASQTKRARKRGKR
jgi:DNA end-binding protein Ku